jgi:hypothetical protein
MSRFSGIVKILLADMLSFPLTAYTVAHRAEYDLAEKLSHSSGQ